MTFFGGSRYNVEILKFSPVLITQSLQTITNNHTHEGPNSFQIKNQACNSTDWILSTRDGGDEFYSSNHLQVLRNISVNTMKEETQRPRKSEREREEERERENATGRM